MCSLVPQFCELLAKATADRAAELRLHTALAYGLIVYGLSLIFSHFFIRAPYGRYASSNWGPKVPAKLGWIVQESPAFIIPVYLWLTQSDASLTSNAVHRVLQFMFLWHYFYRSFIYPLSLRGQSTPIVVVLLAVMFCVWNGYLQGRWLSHLSPAYSPSWFRDPRFIIGFVLFWAGWYTNFEADRILRNLRKPGETSYKIPYGGAFEYVSAANYFGEMLEWCGWALASWSLPSFCFAFFVVCFLGTRGVQHHQWYLTKFKETYPRHRKAVIPYLL